MGWHRDRPHFEHMVGISLGAAASMRFRRRLDHGFDRRTMPLPSRSIYHLRGEARQERAQHRADGGDALVNHAAQPVRARPPRYG
ncbi:hypothetical protein AB5I41_10645 [Sphingomonas sp. MMS24-JH45]